SGIPPGSFFSRLKANVFGHTPFYLPLTSKRSLNAFPKVLKERIVKKIAPAGKKITCGYVRIARQPSCPRLPQLVPQVLQGSLMQRPMKLNVDSAKMADGIL